MLIEVKERYNVVPEDLLGKIKLYTSLTIKRIIDIIGAIIGILFFILYNCSKMIELSHTL